MPTVAVCQTGTAPLDPVKNRASIETLCRTATANGAQIVVLPELAASGYILERGPLADVADLKDDGAVDSRGSRRVARVDDGAG